VRWLVGSAVNGHLPAVMGGPEVVEEGFTHLTYEIGEEKGGVTKLTVIHDLEGAPKVSRLVSGTMDAEGLAGAGTGC